MNGNDDSSDEKRIREIVSSVVSKYSTRNLLSMLGAAFVVGGWATTMQWNVNSAVRAMDQNRQDTNDRMKEWTSWRNSASAKIDKNAWSLEDHEKRITELEKKP